MLWYLTLICFKIQKMITLGQTTFDCLEEYSCFNVALVSYIGANVSCSGTGSCAHSFINNVGTSSDSRYTKCHGKRACHQVLGLKGSIEYPAQIGGFYGLSYSISTINVSSNLLQCCGEASCMDNQQIISHNTLQCDGVNSCNHIKQSTVWQFVHAYGMFSAKNNDYNLELDSNADYNVTINLYGYYSGYNSSFHCQRYQSCTIDCGLNGCVNFNFICNSSLSVCNVICHDTDGIVCPGNRDTLIATQEEIAMTIARIDVPQGYLLEYWNDTAIYNSNLYENYDCFASIYQCNDYQDADCYSNHNIRLNQTTSGHNLCCNGESACEDSAIIANNTTLDQDLNVSIQCNGFSSCKSTKVFSNTNSDIVTTSINVDLTIVCRGWDSCVDSEMTNFRSIIASGSNACYSCVIDAGYYVGCFGSHSCDSSVISNVDYIYATGYKSLMDAEIHSAGKNVLIYVLGYDASNGLTLICNVDDTCKIVCLHYKACTNIGSLLCEHDYISGRTCVDIEISHLNENDTITDTATPRATITTTNTAATPTDPNTNTKTIAPVAKTDNKNADLIRDFGQTAQLIAVGILFVGFFVAGGNYVLSVYIEDHKSDMINVIAIFKYFANTADFWTDLFFNYILFLELTGDQDLFLEYLFDASLFFMLLSYFGSMCIAILWTIRWQRWKQDNPERLYNYLSKYVVFIFALSVISSFYSAIDLLRSKMGYHGIFYLPLKRDEVARLHKYRLVNIVICENIPQLCVQILYVVYAGTYTQSKVNSIVFLSMAFSILGIVFALIVHISEIAGKIKSIRANFTHESVIRSHFTIECEKLETVHAFCYNKVETCLKTLLFDSSNSTNVNYTNRSDISFNIEVYYIENHIVLQKRMTVHFIVSILHCSSDLKVTRAIYNNIKSFRPSSIKNKNRNKNQNRNEHKNDKQSSENENLVNVIARSFRIRINPTKNIKLTIDGFDDIGVSTTSIYHFRRNKNNPDVSNTAIIGMKDIRSNQLMHGDKSSRSHSHSERDTDSRSSLPNPKDFNSLRNKSSPMINRSNSAMSDQEIANGVSGDRISMPMNGLKMSSLDAPHALGYRMASASHSGNESDTSAATPEVSRTGSRADSFGSGISGIGNGSQIVKFEPIAPLDLHSMGNRMSNNLDDGMVFLVDDNVYANVNGNMNSEDQEEKGAPPMKEEELMMDILKMTKTQREFVHEMVSEGK